MPIENIFLLLAAGLTPITLSYALLSQDTFQSSNLKISTTVLYMGSSC
ncbi:MAG: hypothetical protein WBN37_01130 [Arenicellales bacterium]